MRACVRDVRTTTHLAHEAREQIDDRRRLRPLCTRALHLRRQQRKLPCACEIFRKATPVVAAARSDREAEAAHARAREVQMAKWDRAKCEWAKREWAKWEKAK